MRGREDERERIKLIKRYTLFRQGVSMRGVEEGSCSAMAERVEER
jgi:hypothetical protein